MKILPLLSNVKVLGAGCLTAAVLSAGAYASVGSFNNEELLAETAVVDSGEVEVVAVLPVVKDEPKQEENIEPQKEVKTTSQSTKKATQQKAAPKKSASASKPKATQQNNNYSYKPVNTKFSTIMDFESAYMGKCPQEVPYDVWNDPLAPSVALGIRSTMTLAETYTMEGMIRSYWNQHYTTGYPPSGMMNMSFWQIDKSAPDSANITIDWRTMTVSYTYHDLHNTGVSTADHYTPETHAKLKALSQKMTNYLRNLDSRFKNKCGSYRSSRSR